jgi:ribonuclease T2
LNRFIAALLGLLLWGLPASAGDNIAGDFDYYALALSWSPTYCAGNAGQHDNQQCAPGRGYAFVIHGLWPQYQAGWPQNCRTNESWVEQSNIDAMLPVMPSKKLIIHEWKKHGVCSGLSQVEYFAFARKLFESVKVPARYLSPTADVLTTPEQLVLDFIKTNKYITAENLSVQCGNSQDRARLSELRICFDKSGSLTHCGRNEERSCRARTLVMPRVRR